jgi:lipoprotein-anchoring transpeptidase ErfK/SrfK
MFQQNFQRSLLSIGLLSCLMAVPFASGAETPKAKPTNATNVQAPIAGDEPAQERTNLDNSAAAKPKLTEKFKADEVHLLLKLSERRVYVYRGDNLVNKYPVAVGKKKWETPQGEWKVELMLKNPGWTNFKTGEQLAPGPDNPLGQRWIGFWNDGKDEIGFHGTTNLSSIGKAASHGCVRMSNKNVKELFKIVKVGTIVQVRA